MIRRMHSLVVFAVRWVVVSLPSLLAVGLLEGLLEADSEVLRSGYLADCCRGCCLDLS